MFSNLQLYRTNIDLTLPIQKTGYTTYSSSNSDSEKTSFIKKEKVVRKRYVKKRSKKHQVRYLAYYQSSNV